MALGFGKKGGGAPRGNKNAAGPRGGAGKFKSVKGMSTTKKALIVGGVAYAGYGAKVAHDISTGKYQENLVNEYTNDPNEREKVRLMMDKGMSVNEANAALDVKNGLASSSNNRY